MRAGELRHRVTIQQQQVVQDTAGEETVTWVNLATVWAAVEPLAGSERFVSAEAQFLAEATTRIRIRYRAGITPKMRAVFGERTFNIQHIADVDTRGRELYLFCEEQPEEEDG